MKQEEKKRTSAGMYTLRIKPGQIAKDASEYADALINELKRELEVSNATGK